LSIKFEVKGCWRSQRVNPCLRLAVVQGREASNFRATPRRFFDQDLRTTGFHCLGHAKLSQFSIRKEIVTITFKDDVKVQGETYIINEGTNGSYKVTSDKKKRRNHNLKVYNRILEL
jgi:hypothetical protein